MRDVMQNVRNRLTSKSFEESDTISKKIAIYYKGMPWGIANSTICFENIVFPPRKNHNFRYIRVEAEYSNKKYVIRSVKGEIEGALMSMKSLIESKLL